MGKYQKFLLLFTPRTCIMAAFISFLVLLSNYTICNTSFPLPGEMKILRNWDIAKEILGQNNDSIPNNIVLINTSYDKELVDFRDTATCDILGAEPDTLGVVPITNRQKLLEFLTLARKANNYTYIFLDVHFEKGFVSKSDSALFNTIYEMDRIVIPTHEGKKLQDSRLYAKAAIADYTVTKEETTFSRFQFIHEGKKSVPLKMYEDIYNKDIHKFGIFYSCSNWLCRNGITLKLPFTNKDEGALYIPNLGEDILKQGFTPDDIRDKIVIIGDFKGKEDMHDTYLGMQAGGIIILNAFYALVQGDHILLGKFGLTLFFYLFTAILYFFLAVMYLKGKSLSSLFTNPWIKVLVSIISVNFLFLVIASIAYISPLDIVYNIWIPTAIFSVLDFIVNTINNYKDEKSKNRSINSSPAPDNLGSSQSGEGGV